MPTKKTSAKGSKTPKKKSAEAMLTEMYANARKTYAAATCSTVKATLEGVYGKENLVEPPKPTLYNTITTLPQVYKHLKVNPKKDVIKVDGATTEDIEMLESIIARMRVAKVYNNGKQPKRGSNRYYPYHRLASGSGLAFSDSFYDHDSAHLSSAARLSFTESEGSTAYVTNFPQIEKGIIQY